MLAALGFAAFGRPRRRHVRRDSEAGPPPQLMPGTEIAGRQVEFPVGTVETAPHGVLYLLHGGSSQDGVVTALLPKPPGESRGGFAVPYSALLDELQREKCCFDKLETRQFLRARAATNPFETIGRRQFLNRSAMKLVTMDHIFQWTHTLCTRQDPFTFVDICGGPGGFSEYLLWRAAQLGAAEGSQPVRGYGITLKDATNNCDWRVAEQPTCCFTICYGQDGTGDLYSLPNIRSFCDQVHRMHPDGVDLAVADGGFLDARSQPNQVRSSLRYSFQ